MTDSLVDRARDFAIHAHRRIDQRRKYSGQPYDAHLKAVAGIVQTVTDNPEIVAAAWLHDTLEDTPATYEEIEAEFGERVAHLVMELTDVSRPADGNRAVRKAIDRLHLSRASPAAKTVKLADLIDNCADIVKHDTKFARVFVTEASALLEVLSNGDPRLLSRARKAIGKSASKLGLPELNAAVLEVEPGFELPSEKEAQQRRFAREFAATFRATDIAEPLRSFDSDRDSADIHRILADCGSPVAGVRIDGTVVGYTSASDLERKTAQPIMRSFAPDQVIAADDPLTDVIHVLNRHDFCFVTALGEVTGYVSRAEIQKPLVRMWLFGLITLREMHMTDRIKARWPDDGWRSLLSGKRVAKAREMQDERERRGLPSRLVDCLQFSDKGQILMEDREYLAELGFRTKGAVKRVIKEIESLRNHLAHGQDFVSHDWAQIARMVANLSEMAGDEE